MINKEKIEFNDQISENILKIKDLFPNTVTESETGIKIDFDKLKEELSKDLMDSKEERYQMTWPGKKASIKISNQPTDKTLIPDRDSSFDFDNTQNIYIEGDNLEALKLLKKSYEGKIKCIYIDPPYNTGHDFVYKDSFDQDKDDYLSGTNQLNEEGGKLVNNPETSGRFHSNWLSMMYPRLKLARDLLSNSGVMFISIDDNEVTNFRKIADEIFGEENFILQFTTISNPRGRQTNRLPFALTHEYVLAYSKSIRNVLLSSKELTQEQKNEYKHEDSNGSYRLLGLRKRGSASNRSDRPNLFFPIYINLKDNEISITKKDGLIEVYPKKEDESDGVWRWQKSKVEKDKKLLVAKTVKRKGVDDWDIFVKDYISNDGEEKGSKFKSVLLDKKFNNENGTEAVKKLFDNKVFDYPKPLDLIEEMINFGINSNVDDSEIILDFFSGSSTTAHAIMKINSQDEGNRKYIMIQIPEKTPEDSEAYKACYKNICEIGKERIRRAAKKIKEETSAEIDYGFKVFKVSDSIINHEIELTPSELPQNSLKFENIREGLSNEDLLYSAILKTGLPLDSKVVKEKISNSEFFTVVDSENNNILVACFDKDINFNENIIKFITSQNPLRVYFRDSSFKSDSEKINFEQKLNELTSESVEIFVL